MSVSSFWNYFNTFILYQGCVWLNRYTYNDNDDNTKGRASKLLAIKFWSHLNIHVCMFVFPCAGRDHSNASAYKLFLTFRFFLQHITRHIKFKTEQNFFHWRILSFAKTGLKRLMKKWNVVNVAPSKAIRILGKIFLVESAILGFGIQVSALGIRNATNDWNPESTT